MWKRILSAVIDWLSAIYSLTHAIPLLFFAIVSLLLIRRCSQSYTCLPAGAMQASPLHTTPLPLTRVGYLGEAPWEGARWGCERVPPTGEHNEQDAGDHQGPPSPSPPPSPLRTDEHVSKKPTHESTTPAPTICKRYVICRRSVSRNVSIDVSEKSLNARYHGAVPAWR